MPAQTITVIGCGFVALGSLLPWATVSVFFGTISKAGTDGDGAFTLILGLVGLGLVFARRGGLIATGVLMALVALIAVYDIVDVSRLANEAADDEFSVSVSVGYGLWLVAAGAIGACIAAFIAVSQLTKRRVRSQ